MSVKAWAIKPGEVKPLDRAGLLLLGARVALRVGPWVHGPAVPHFQAVLAGVVQAAVTGAVLDVALQAERRGLADLGARICNRLDATDEPRGRAHNYAHQVLVAVSQGADALDRATVLKSALEAAKYAGSIAAIWGHAGRVLEVLGTPHDPVDYACGLTWAALRADVALIVCEREALLAAPDPLAALLALAPHWPEPPPSWAAPTGP